MDFARRNATIVVNRSLVPAAAAGTAYHEYPGRRAVAGLAAILFLGFPGAPALTQELPAKPQAQATERPDPVLQELSELNDRAFSLELDRKYVEAQELREQALERATRAYGSAHPEVLFALFGLAANHVGQKNYPEALKLFSRAQEVAEKLMASANAAELWGWVNNLLRHVQTLAEEKDAPQRARALLERSVQFAAGILRRLESGELPRQPSEDEIVRFQRVSELRDSLSGALVVIGRRDEAVALLERDANEIEQAHERGLVKAHSVLDALSSLQRTRYGREQPADAAIEARKLRAVERDLAALERLREARKEDLDDLERSVRSLDPKFPGVAAVRDRLDAFTARLQGPDSPEAVGNLVRRAYDGVRSGDYSRAVRALEQVRDLLGKGSASVARTLVLGVPGSFGSQIERVLSNLVSFDAEARYKAKDVRALRLALEVAEQALEMVVPDLGSKPDGGQVKEVSDLLLWTARARVSLGEEDSARDRLVRAAEVLVRAYDAGTLDGGEVSRSLTSILLDLKFDDESAPAKRLLSLQRGFLQKYVARLSSAEPAAERDQALARALQDLIFSYQRAKELDEVRRTSLRLAELRVAMFERRTAAGAAAQSGITRSFSDSHPAEELAHAADAFENAGQKRRAADVYERAAQACQTPEPCARGAASLYLEAARIFDILGEVARSRAAGEQAVQHAERQVESLDQRPDRRPDDSALPMALGVLSNAYEFMGRMEDAARVEERRFEVESARSDRVGNLGPDIYLSSAAGKYNSAGNHDKAIELQRRYADAKLKEHGPFHKDSNDALDTLRRYYVDADRLNEAASLIDVVIAEYRKRGEESVFADRDATLTVAKWFSHLGSIQRTEGRFDEALGTYQRVLNIRRRVLADTDSGVIEAVADIANVHRERGALSDAARAAEIALDLARSRGGRDVAARWLGALLVDLGQLERARALLRTVSRESEEVGDIIQGTLPESFSNDPIMRAVANATRIISTKVRIKPLIELGLVHLRIGDMAEANKVLRRALALSEELKDRSLDFVRLLTFIGQTDAALGNHAAAAASYARAHELASRMRRRGAPERIAILLGRAEFESVRGNAREAMMHFEQAQAEAQLRPDSIVRAEAQFAYAQHFARQKHWELAILLGKGAVNAAQAARASLSGADQEIQRQFAASRSTYYQTLAGWLVERGRLPEAQQVLAMLKEDELFEYLRSGGNEDVRKTQAALTGEESRWSARFAEIRGRLAAIGAELEALERKARAGLSDAEKTRRAELERDRDVGQQAFEKFMGDLMRELAATASSERSLEIGRRNLGDLQALQDTLAALGHGAVTLHYLVLPERTHIVLTTPQVQLAREARIAAADLNQKIQAYRRVLQNPKQNPLPLAQELYRLLVEPVAADLKQAGARTLMVSLDGALRYLPLAALHDGERYLAESYALALYTEAAKDRLKDRPEGRWQFAGLGLTRQIEGFSPLPAVREELEGIVRDGILPGEVHFDEQFNAERLRATLDRRPPVLHIASHFVFRPGIEANSFLLLGDGNQLSLAELRRYRFRDVDLITLSACETAVGGGKDANGREIEGFGALAQRQGAKGVLATLWPVADRGTGDFMRAFYRIRQSDPSITKAEALRRAQLGFIRGAAAGTASDDATRGARRADAAPAAAQAAAPYAHPFYWAPFILMGNWL
ncbi:MAG: CHAT domain-containing protein [Betaproteobacteria bacterium]|nr:CHAT domain-containing protein [Betaproteobacteria bacterium]